jgi:ribosome maturation factor RimP
MTAQRRVVGVLASVRERVAPVLARSGLVVEDVTLTRAGSRQVLRVVVDLAGAEPEPVSMDAVARASREVSAELDQHDVMGGSEYVLEVTSPGVGRPLTEPRHYRRNVGRTLTVTLTDGSELQGRLLAVVGEPPQTLSLRVAGPKKGATTTCQAAWDDVAAARVEVEFRSTGPAPDEDRDLPTSQDEDED